MKITKEQLKQIIKEELNAVLMAENPEKLQAMFKASPEGAVQATELWSSMNGVDVDFAEARDYEGLPAVYVGFEGDDYKQSASKPFAKWLSSMGYKYIEAADLTRGEYRMQSPPMGGSPIYMIAI